MPRYRLSARDKLALALTSAGSERNLAGALGITHQKLGRWLREGEPEGIKKIPADAAPLIAQVWKMHKSLVREQAKVDNLPWSDELPVYAHRKKYYNRARKRVVTGNRVFVENARFIRRDLRMQYLHGMQSTGKFLAVHAGSYVNLYKYFRAVFDQLVATGQRSSQENPDRAVHFMIMAFTNSMDFDLKYGHSWINTERVRFTPRDGVGSLLVLERQLTSKMEPAAADKTSRIADQYVMVRDED